MRAYHFVDPAEARDPWLAPPGTWIGPHDGASGVTVLRPETLSWWLAPELWEVECDGVAIERTDSIEVPRARRISRVEAWSPELRARFVAHVSAEARLAASGSERPELSNELLGQLPPEGSSSAAGAGYVAAMIAASTAADPGEARRRFLAAREAQSRWLERALFSPA